MSFVADVFVSVRIALNTLAALMVAANCASATVLQYGDKDVLGTGAYYSTDPVTGATLEGLAPGVSTVGFFGLTGFAHSYPFSPSVDFVGTDQIYVGSTHTGSSDGYAGFSGRLNGPQTIAMDYNSIVPVGETIDSLTLGIGFDDFQFPAFGQAYTVSINGIADPALTTLANSFGQTGPRASFATIGISPSNLDPSHILTLSIDQGGTGGDGWAIDFLTVGVTTVPEPFSLVLTLFGLALLPLRRW